MTLAAISVIALALTVLLSCVVSINVGVVAIATAWIIGVYVGGLPVNTVMAGFPTSLFLTLTGVSLLFSLASCNGTLDRLTHHAVRACRGNRGVIPVMFFVLAAALASMGPGNIATAALIAPIAMATATRVGIPLFLMSIMVGNGANAGALSPFAPTGIIVNGLMQRIGLPGYELPTYLYTLAAHALVAFGGYAVFGGLRLFVREAPADESATATPENAPAFERRHWVTLGVIAALILSVLLAEVNVGMGAFLAAVMLVLGRFADDAEAIRRMPWKVIVMVCGVTVLIALLEKAQGIDLLVGMVTSVASAATINPAMAFFTGLVSVYSSTSGVVLPAFLPMVPGLAQQLGAAPLGIAVSMYIGGHLVDVSPLSTIGALCIAGAPVEESRALFNRLLAWGLSMCVVGAAVCWLLF